MPENSTIEVGQYQIAITPFLRELFSRTHAAMSGKRPTDEQYPHDEQYEMYLLCEATVPGNKSVLDEQKTEENLLELMHFLNGHGVAIPRVIALIRCFGSRTTGVAMRLHVHEVRQHQMTEATKRAAMPQFLPALAAV